MSINNSDIHYSWTIAQAAAAGDGAVDDESNCRYGILLARMAGLPVSITSRALQVAERLEQKQQERQQMQQQEQGTHINSLRQVGCGFESCYSECMASQIAHAELVITMCYAC